MTAPETPLSSELGEPTPSFVRPALINWILNKQDGNALADLETNVARKREIVRALQRATLRPLPILDLPEANNTTTMAAEVRENFIDRASGVLQLSYANFSGSNTHPGFSTPISMVNPSGAGIVQLAQALAGEDFDGNGVLDSWDVDNNGDGVNDSLWIDAGLPIGESVDGGFYKPLVAYMVEDLGGRVDVNRAGNLAQVRRRFTNGLSDPIVVQEDISGAVQHESPVPVLTIAGATSPIGFSTAGDPALFAPTGFGYGPAEIDVRGLFSLGYALASTDPLLRGPQRLIRERLLTLSSREGQLSSLTPLSWVSSPSAVTPTTSDQIYRSYVAAGELIDPFTLHGNDILGAIRDPLRANLHDHRESQGLPTDTFGRGAIGLDIAGSISVGGTGQSVYHAGLGEQGLGYSAVAPGPRDDPNVNNSLETLGTGDAIDDPYEFAASAGGSPDSPYTDSELYPLLNYADLDRDLVRSRLIELIEDYHNQPITSTVQRQQVNALLRIFADSVTTSSKSAAVATGTLPVEWQNDASQIEELNSTGPITLPAANAALPPNHLLMEALNAAVSGLPPGQRDQARNALTWELFPQTIREGGRLNLNRPFGNGVNDDDDNDDGVIGTMTGASEDNYEDVIDDPEEVAVGQVYYRYDGIAGPTNSGWSSSRGDISPGEHNFNGTAAPNNRDVSGRAVFARHLYTLMMLLTRDSAASPPVNFEYPIDAGSLPPFTALTANSLTQEEEYRAWKIAQWAVNVADFRDPDAIMTRFDYDPDPFDGWDVRTVGGNPTFRTVWGMEFPELTLEESLAFHDRRVRDTAVDTTSGRAIQGGTVGPDNDADQYEIPEGSLFLELRSTRSPQPSSAPGTAEDDAVPLVNPMSYPPELYTQTGSMLNPDWRLDLGRLAPDNNPVWRVAISEYHSQADPPTLLSAGDFLLKPLGADASAPAGNAQTIRFSDPILPDQDRETATLNPTVPQFFSPSYRPLAIDRVIWFTSLNPDSSGNGVTDYLRPTPPMTPDYLVPPDSLAAGNIYYNRSAIAPQLLPGQSVVIAPRSETFLGTARRDTGGNPVIDASTDAPLAPFNEFRSPQSILIAGRQVQLSNLAGTSLHPIYEDGTGQSNASVREILPVVAASNRPSGWTGANTATQIGVNVSEPYEITAAAVTNATTVTSTGPLSARYGGATNLTTRTYYPEPSEPLRDVAGYDSPYTSWYNFDTPTGNRLPDEPFDARPNSELNRIEADDPLGSQQSGTRNHFKTAYLQRLADPTRPYDPIFNPYRSVDYISIDLTVFNGSQDNAVSTPDSANPPDVLWPDPFDEDPYNTIASEPQERLASRYKSGMPVNEDITAAPELAGLTLSVNTMPPDQTPVQSTPNTSRAFFNVELSTSADINTAANQAAALTIAQSHGTTLGWTNHSYGRRWQQPPAADVNLAPYVGLPFEPFRTNVAWLNRQFVAPSEIMWVPTTSAARAGIEFDEATGSPDRYDDTVGVAGSLPSSPTRYSINQRFTHLWNYFTQSPLYSSANSSPNFYRLLDFVEVPPPFDDDSDFISPEVDPFDLVTSGAGTVPGEQSRVAATFSWPSFTSTSDIDADPRTWDNAWPGASADRSFNNGTGSWQPVTPGTGRTNGFWTDYVSMEPFRPPFGFRSKPFRSGLINLNTIKTSRVYRALMSGVGDQDERNVMDNAMPFWTEFNDSRRGYSLSALGPADLQQLRPTLNPDIPSQIDGVFKPSNAERIEPRVTTMPARGGNAGPLDSTVLRRNPSIPTQPLFSRAPVASAPFVDPNHSVVHDQIAHTRLDNLATDQSNVFAVWITVGLFEVDGQTMTVGQELGAELGEVRRFRAFHIVDRSIPVRYEPGQRNNILDTVKLSRVSQ
ncbi:MAG: hypothetical protein AAF539_10295 [Planctomycetota bacterium]